MLDQCPHTLFCPSNEIDEEMMEEIKKILPPSSLTPTIEKSDYILGYSTAIQKLPSKTTKKPVLMPEYVFRCEKEHKILEIAPFLLEKQIFYGLSFCFCLEPQNETQFEKLSSFAKLKGASACNFSSSDSKESSFKNLTHFVVDGEFLSKNPEKVQNAFLDAKNKNPALKSLKIEWFEECIQKNQLIDTKSFEIELMKDGKKPTVQSPSKTADKGTSIFSNSFFIVANYGATALEDICNTAQTDGGNILFYSSELMSDSSIPTKENEKNQFIVQKTKQLEEAMEAELEFYENLKEICQFLEKTISDLKEIQQASAISDLADKLEAFFTSKSQNSSKKFDAEVYSCFFIPEKEANPQKSLYFITKYKFGIVFELALDYNNLVDELESTYNEKFTNLKTKTQQLHSKLKMKKISITTLQWIDDCSNAKQLLEIGSNIVYSPLPLQEISDFLQFFENGQKNFSLTNFLGAQRSDMIFLMQEMGAKYSGVFSQDDSRMLICNSKEKKGEKFTISKKWGVPVVAETWVYACTKAWKLVPLDPYLLEKLPNSFVFPPSAIAKIAEKPSSSSKRKREKDEKPQQPSKKKRKISSKKTKNAEKDEEDEAEEVEEDEKTTEAQQKLNCIVGSFENYDHYKKLVEKLHGIYWGTFPTDDSFTQDNSVVILGSLKRTEKLLYAFAKGIPVLKPQFLEDSKKLGKLASNYLDYEWNENDEKSTSSTTTTITTDDTNSNTSSSSAAKNESGKMWYGACKFWREKLKLAPVGAKKKVYAFSGWKAFIIYTTEESKAKKNILETITRLLKLGGADVETLVQDTSASANTSKISVKFEEESEKAKPAKGKKKAEEKIQTPSEYSKILIGQWCNPKDKEFGIVSDKREDDLLTLKSSIRSKLGLANTNSANPGAVPLSIIKYNTILDYLSYPLSQMDEITMEL